MKRGKYEFSDMKILILDKNRSKEVRKVFKKLEKEQRAKKDIHRTFFYNEAFFKKKIKKKKKKKTEKKKRWLDATDVPRPRLMTTECAQTLLAQQRHDTQQWSRGPSFAHAILNACES